MASVSTADEGTVLAVRFDDGEELRLDRSWLRDSCQCPECLHRSGQRLVSVNQLEGDVRLAEATAENGTIALTFAPDGHRSRFATEWLRAQAAPRPPSVEIWDASLAVPAAEHAEICAGGPELARWLGDVDRLGLGLLRGVPCEDGQVARVAELFSPVRVTNYGKVFDVRSVVDPANLADTALALGPHTDNPYRVPVPTLQLLHCLQSSSSGGESTFVDGLRVAEELRREDPEAFDLLSSVPVRFSYRSADAALEAEAPVLELDARGDVAAVRYNTRSAHPPCLAAGRAAAWYAAYRRFAELAQDPRLVVRVTLAPGELALFDNRRVLHGRTAFGATRGERHLQGCYAEVDGLRSRLALLREDA
jgi:gamma-butyrobetaine hydroxylase